MSVGGLVSGLDTNTIITKVMDLARQPETELSDEKTAAQAKLAAWQDLNTRVLAVKMKAAAIADASDFGLLSATSSNEDVLTATASSSATPGTYYVKVTSRAQSHQVASQAGAYTSLYDVVGTGTVHIAQQNGSSFDVTLDSNNSTLVGLRDAINNAGEGVKATIINAGSTDSPSYRMLLTSTTAGTDNAMTTMDTSGLSGGTAPVFDLNNPVQTATSATVEMGDGAGKITVNSNSNSITGLIPGVTLNIASADTSQTITVDVARDTSTIKKTIEDFVTQYNDLAENIAKQFQYDSTTSTSGTLMGDFQLQSLQMDIESAVSSSVEGLSSQYSALSTIGITRDTSGDLTIDDSKLSAALENHIDDVTKIFSSSMQSNNSYVSYLASTSDTQPSGKTGWQIDVTQAARRAQVTAGTAMTSPLDANESLTVNGKTINLTKNMDIDAVISAINSHSTDTNVVALKTGADGTGTGDYLTLRRVQYGSSYDVSVVSNLSHTAGNTSGLGNGEIKATDTTKAEDGLGQVMAGLNVAGTINGETATGNGQILTLNSISSTNAAKGLSVLVTATSPFDSATVTFTKGVGARLTDLLATATSTTGVVTTAEDGINSQIDDLTKSIADMESRLSDQEARLTTEFNDMESKLAELQSQGNYLTAQFAAMNKST